jgi:hypothetical protein
MCSQQRRAEFNYSGEMTEEQKWRVLVTFEQRARIAEENNLPATAKSWRDRHRNLLGAEAANVIFVDRANERNHVT